jgi:hypothetical protein
MAAEWTCTRCTFIAINPQQCQICGEINHTHVSVVAQEQAQSTAAAAAVGGAAAAPPTAAATTEPHFWACSACTCENPVGARACAACEAPAPGALASTDAEWFCDACTFRNAPTSAACEVCASKPPFTLGELEGEGGGGGGAAPAGGGGSSAPFVLPGAPPSRLALGGGRAAALHLEGETPLPQPLPAAPPGAADPVLALPRSRLLGSQLSRCVVFTRQLGHSGQRASRYRASAHLRALYKAALGDEAAAVEEGVAEGNEALAALRARGGGGGASGGASGDAGDGGGASSKAISALQKEMAFFTSNDTNTAWEGSLFVRADEGNLLALRAAVTGPADTPYANGFFCFDIACEGSGAKAYPQCPPHVLIATRASGGVRFNPNREWWWCAPPPPSRPHARTPRARAPHAPTPPPCPPPVRRQSTPAARCACRCWARGRAPAGSRACPTSTRCCSPSRASS